MPVTLIIEDGSKPQGANSYVSLEEATAYHTTQGNDVWTGNTDDDLRSQALVLATQAVDLLYGDRYLSVIASNNQSLLFPRASFADRDTRVVLDNQIPQALKNAVCELAARQLVGEDITPALNTDSYVRVKEVEAGDVASKVEYFKAPAGESFVGFTNIDRHLRPILKPVYASSWRLVP